MKESYLLLLLLIGSSIAYQYEYVASESLEEEDPILGFNIFGLIGGFIKSRINSLKDPNFWIQKLGDKLKSQMQKWSEANSHVHTIYDDIKECDKNINKENNDQVVAIRKEVGLPLDIRAFCQGNPDCGTKIRNDYDYLDYVIFKIPRPKFNPYDRRLRGTGIPRIFPRRIRLLASTNDPKYLEARAKVDKLQQILRKMDENFQKCIQDPNLYKNKVIYPRILRK